jgi:hypothetical protein
MVQIVTFFVKIHIDDGKIENTMCNICAYEGNKLKCDIYRHNKDCYLSCSHKD